MSKHSNNGCMKHLTTICLDFILARPPYAYVESFSILPYNLKTIILKRIATRNLCGTKINIIRLLKNLMHSELKEINLGGTKWTDELLEAVSICRKLNVLKISRANKGKITEQVLLNVFPNFTNLVALEISTCDVLTDDVVKVIVQNNRNVSRLNFSNCINITDNILEEISTLSRLLSLDISGTMITDYGIETLANGSSKNILKELSIKKCTNITENAIQTVFCSFSDIEIFFYSDLRVSFGNDYIIAFRKYSNYKSFTLKEWLRSLNSPRTPSIPC